MDPYKRKFGPLEVDAREVVFNVYKYFKERKQDKTTPEFQNDINLAKTAAKATGISQKTILRIVKEAVSDGSSWENPVFHPPKKNFHPKKRIELSEAVTKGIREKIENHRNLNKEFPTIRQLNEELKSDNLLYCSDAHLNKIVCELGYNFHKRKLQNDNNSEDSSSS